jgi:large subunit ribosomal protein L2
MGKRIISQARGAGGPRYRAPSHRFVSDARYMALKDFQKGGVLQVIDFTCDPVRSSPLMELMNEQFKSAYLIAPVGVSEGDVVEYGAEVSINPGNITVIENVPAGTPVYNMELVPGDGGKIVRASGLAAYVISQDNERKKTLVRLPSKNKVEMDFGCRVTIGTIAGGGRVDKPFVKAGNKHHDMASRNKLYPIVSGTNMNAADHPHGGRTSLGRNDCCKRNAPPGSKVGNIAPSRTGVRKTKIVKEKSK